MMFGALAMNNKIIENNIGKFISFGPIVYINHLEVPVIRLI